MLPQKIYKSRLKSISLDKANESSIFENDVIIKKQQMGLKH